MSSGRLSGLGVLASISSGLPVARSSASGGHVSGVTVYPVSAAASSGRVPASSTTRKVMASSASSTALHSTPTSSGVMRATVLSTSSSDVARAVASATWSSALETHASSRCAM